jgi:hypothetical protein
MASALKKLKGAATPFPIKRHYEANYFLFTIESKKPTPKGMG